MIPALILIVAGLVLVYGIDGYDKLGWILTILGAILVALAMLWFAFVARMIKREFNRF